MFLKTLLTTTDCLITSPKTSITHLFFRVCFFLIKKYKSRFDNKPAKINGLHKENKNLQSCILLSTFPCSGHLLYFCPWYLSDSLRGKKQSTSQSIIAALQSIPSVGQMKRTQACWIRKTHTHTRKIFSSWRESKCWGSKSKQPLNPVSAFYVHKWGKLKMHITIIHKTYSVLNGSSSFLDICWQERFCLWRRSIVGKDLSTVFFKEIVYLYSIHGIPSNIFKLVKMLHYSCKFVGFI